ncbi:MAG: hypothetical protein IPM47_14085 [Sphingobacteriales bacterium]|nr:MAG: hypothetical protein IPM47_14085 [Sphingobacteriales bacterium]
MENKILLLEKKVLNLQRLNYLMLAVIVFFMVTAFGVAGFPDVEPVLKAEKFELVNSQGKTILVMEPRETAAEIALYSNEGKRLISLGSEVRGEGGLIQLNNRKGNNLMQFRSNDTGAALKMYDDQNNSIVFIGEDILNDRAGIVSIAKNDTQRIILNGNDKTIYVANSLSKSGYSLFPSNAK